MKAYIIEIKTVGGSLPGSFMKNRGGESEGIFHDVIENKWRKNVRFLPFHDVAENKDVIVVFPRC